MAAPAFVKNPKFIGGAIVFLWVTYVVYWNYRLEPINIQLFPVMKPEQLSVSSVIIGSAVFGRKPDYDVRQDSVVRTEAAKLRARLKRRKRRIKRAKLRI